MSKLNSNNKDLSLWLSNEISNAEIQKEINSKDYNKYQQILTEIDEWRPSLNDDIFDPTEIIKKSRSKNKFIPKMRYAVGFAASLIIMMVLGYISFYNPTTFHETGAEQLKEIVLPDQISFITLAPNSSIEWSKSDWNDSKRHVYLKGKAFFKIASGSPFEVESNKGTVLSLGTSFDISESEHTLKVVCYEGKVQASSKEKDTIIVNSGEASLYHEGSWQQKNTFTESSPTWLDNSLVN